MATIDDKHTHLDTNDARGGAETGTVRWVLRISLGLTVLAGLVIYFAFFHHL